ncbi:MAG: amidohydrolase family protein [Planctomycetes bacterium]|nr:amidohydrolase family protein [Planctomycetota bacterium]
MSSEPGSVTRRNALMAMGVWGTAAAVGSGAQEGPASDMASADEHDDFRRELELLVNQTALVDTHEHLPDEEARLRGEWVPCDDWGVLFSHYIDSDLVSAGMPEDDLQQLLARDVDPAAKWKLLAPWWPAIKNTGYGRAVRIAMQELYDIDELNEKTVARLQNAYESVRRPGFYQRILVEMAGIECCHVDSLGSFRESRQPTLLLQDLNIVGMHMGPDVQGLAAATGKEVHGLDDWHGVIRWWFEKYGSYAVAVKSQAAYRRGLDYEQVPAEQAEPVLKRVLEEAPVSAEDRKLLEDHLFWYAVEQATQHELPVKLHTGYYVGHNYMPLERLAGNPAQAADLCRKSPDTQWVFMHIAYPYWQDLLAVAKHYRNAHIDLCWAWIIDPAASTRFLKSHLLTAPANKVFVFGGDYIPVECVLGHARMARQGVVRALWELVGEGYLSRGDALELIEPLLRGNAHRLYRLQAKIERLRQAPWA